MNIFEDLSKNRIKYGTQLIPVYFDDNNDIWFGANEVVITLGYANTKGNIQYAIRNKVPRIDRQIFSKFKSGTRLFHQNKLFLNEAGLYRLILRSKMKQAEKFSDWVTREVLPSIRKYGSYKSMQIHKKDVIDIMERINYLEEENKKLKQDLKKTKFPDGGTVYVANYSTKYEELYRIGMTGNMNNRKKGYNTHTLHNHEIIYRVPYDSPFQLETCLRAMLYKYKYSSKKDFYQCSLRTIKLAIKRCIKEIALMKKQKGGKNKRVKSGSKTNPLPKKQKNFIETDITRLRKRVKHVDKKINQLNLKLTN